MMEFVSGNEAPDISPGFLRALFGSVGGPECQNTE